MLMNEALIYLSFFSFRLNIAFFFQSHPTRQGFEIIAHQSLLKSGSWNGTCLSNPETICVNE